MERRTFIRKATTGAVTTATVVAAPYVIAQPKMQWRMVTTWPKNFPGLGSAAELLAQLISEASNGRLTVKVFGAGEIVLPFEAMDAVAGGIVEMGHGAPYYWKDKVPASQYIAALPFGLTAQEMNAWFQYGGGQELADKVYGELGCKFFVSGNTGAQMGGWFNKEINRLDDYKRLKMRIPGLGGEVLKAAGGIVVNLPGGEIPRALESGVLDAAEWVGPYNDLAFGLYKSAKFYYYPGWHEPATSLDNFINLKAWNSLPPDLKSIVATANTAVNQLMLSEFVSHNNAALETLISMHNVKVMKFPDELLHGLGKLASEVLTDLTSKDPLSKEVFNSIVKFRKGSIKWSRLSEQSYLSARDLSSKVAL